MITPSRRRTRFQVLCVFLSWSVLLPLSAHAQQKPASSQDPLVRMNESMDALTKKVWPSVVQIMVSSYTTQADSDGRETSVVIGKQSSTGSGFVIDADGYIMTNAHVVNGARRIQVVLPAENADGTLSTALSGRTYQFAARIVGITTELDLALLKVDGQKLPALALATYSQVRQGETVFAFGSPIGLRNSLTHGLISAVARQIDPDSPLIFVQTDAPINPGNSGGPLVNIRGEVVGVNTFILSQSGGNEGLGFAIPSATVRTVYRQLRQYGQLRRQIVGMNIQTITHDMGKALGLPRDYGVIVSDVTPGGPADKGGLKVGDILISIDGQPADNLPTVNYNFRLRDTTENVQMVVLRAGTQHTLSITPVEQRSDFDSVSSMADPEKHLVPELGLLGLEINPTIATKLEGLRAPYGVIVVARAAGAASEVPLQPRDVIRSVNNREVSSLQALRETVRKLPSGTPVTMQIQRDDRLMYVSFVLD